MYQINKTVINQWLKGVGAFLLIIIYSDNLLTTIFKGLEKNEKHDISLYLVLSISIIYLPVLVGKFLDSASLILTKIIKSWQLTNNSWKLEFMLSWFLSISLNTIAIQKLFTQGTSESFHLYLKPDLLKDIVMNHLLSLNFLGIILVASILTTVLFVFCFLFIIRRFLGKSLIEYIILLGVTVSVAIVVWDLIYLNNGLFHLNAFLFPLAASSNNSPFIPLVSEGFATLYGGYFLWLGLLTSLIGNSLLSIKLILFICVVLQVILYFVITKCLLKNSLIRILTFLCCIFWSYFYGKVVTHDLYFQYFPLRTLFPSIFIIASFYSSTYCQKFFKKVIFSNKFFKITSQDFLLDIIVAISILNNFDSGVSVLTMYFFIYNWTFLKSANFKFKQLIKQLIGLSINLTIVTTLFLLIFRLLAGNFPNFSLLTAFTAKFGAGFFGLPFPDNLWMIFVVFYTFNLVQSFSSNIEDITAKYRFSIAIWGLVSLVYFVNRSHPWNLVNVSLPFFLSYGFFVEQSFNSLLDSKKISESEFKQDKIDFIKIIATLLSNWFDLLKLAFNSVFIMPFIIMSLIACLQFIPLMVYHLKYYPKSYSEIAQVEALSQKVANLETQLNRPSILIDDSWESYYYLLNRRKVLFYPEAVSIFDLSFKPQFIKAINTFNPIVTVCQLNVVFEPKLHGTIVELLHENKYKIQESEGGCDVYIKE